MYKILIVDDNEKIRLVFRTLLKEFDIYEASNGKECIDVYKYHKPDLVLMDILMPEMDGINTTKELLKIDPDAKIVAISAYSEHAEEILKAGAREVLSKPLGRVILLEKVIEHLGLQEMKDFLRKLYEF